jgi:SAM-dependent methyltransferase
VRHVCEIGGGRNPLFSPEELAAFDVEYTILDISQAELDLAGPEYHKLCCSIEETDHQPEFDMMYSKMVIEHVSNTQLAYENIRDKLNPRGVCLSFHPTLYALPFIVNLLLPERLSRKVLGLIFPSRMNEESKFPARYSWCFASRKIVRRLKVLGFRDALIVPFYGHTYYKNIPVLRSLENWWHGVARRADLKASASYAYTIVRR